MNKGFDEAWLEKLKSRNDIVTIMSRYLTLQQKGRNYWACCPFHHENQPSMCIYAYDQYYHCYGCKEHGDVITFVMKMESCDFMTAIEILAKNANMEIPALSMDEDVQKRKKQKETILQILDLAYKHYEQNLYLKTSIVAQNYIKKRKMTKSDLDKFHIGYSISWTDMTDYLKSEGFSYEDMKMAGIAECKNNRYYDVFGERLMFPIFNIHDECIGFSARSLSPDAFAKYKNSINTLVFDKSKNMFGANYLKTLKQSKKLDYIIIVEGQVDLITMHHYGFTNSVACLGTALTPLHARMLSNLCNNVILSFDGDSAGQKATIRTIDTLVQSGMNVRAIKIPENMDPDEFLNKYGKEKYQQLLDNAIDYIQFKIQNKMEQYDLSKFDEKAKFVNDAIDIVNTLNRSSEKEVYLDIIKNLTGVSKEGLKRDLLDQKDKPEAKSNQQDEALTCLEDAEIKSIKFILASLLKKKDYANFDFNLAKYLINPTYTKLYELMKEYNQNGQNLLITTLYDNFDIDNEPNLKDIIEYDFDSILEPKTYYNECIWKVRETYLKQIQKQLGEKFSNEQDTNKKLEITKEIVKIQQKLRNKILED